MANPVTQVPQGRRQVAQASCSSTAAALWVTARGRLYQLAQIIKQRDIPGREFLPPAARSTNPTRRDIRRRAPQSRQTSPDRAAGHQVMRERRNAAPSCRPHFGRRKPPPTPLVQNRIKRCGAQLYGHPVQHAQTLRDPHPVPESPTQSRFGYSSTNPKYQLARVTTGDFAAAGQIGTTRSAMSIVERRWATMMREIGSDSDRALMARSFSSSRWLVASSSSRMRGRDRARGPARRAASGRPRASCPCRRPASRSPSACADLVVDGGKSRRVLDPLGIGGRVERGDVLGDRARKQPVILQHAADLRAIMFHPDRRHRTCRPAAPCRCSAAAARRGSSARSSSRHPTARRSRRTRRLRRRSRNSSITGGSLSP